MKVSYSEERRARSSSLNLGKSLSEDTRKKIFLAKKGVSVTFSEEGYKAATKSVAVYNSDNTVKGTFNSIKEASLALCCDRGSIRKSAKKGTLLKASYRVSFI